MIQIIPGINEKNLQEIERKITSVAPHTECIQIDIADNTIISSETFLDIACLEPTVSLYGKTGTQFEAHLMVGKPQEYLKQLAEAGFSRVFAHVECIDPRDFLAEAGAYDMEVGLAIDVDTDFESIEPFLEEIDCVLIMTVEAGASGQDFESDAVEKIKIIHRNLPDLPIEVDGGMTPETAKIVTEAGATRIVSTSYIFKNEQDIPSAIAALQNA